MSLVKGIHHVSMKCCSEEEYRKTVAFYRDILGLAVEREWQDGIMLDTGAGIIEIFNNGEEPLEKGTSHHTRRGLHSAKDRSAKKSSFSAQNRAFCRL